MPRWLPVPTGLPQPVPIPGSPTQRLPPTGNFRHRITYLGLPGGPETICCAAWSSVIYEGLSAAVYVGGRRLLTLGLSVAGPGLTVRRPMVIYTLCRHNSKEREDEP